MIELSFTHTEPVSIALLMRFAFSSSRENEGRRRAIALAVQDARADAEAAATAAGGRLGPLLELTLTPDYNGYARMAAASSLYSLSQTSISPGNVSAVANAQMRFVFIPNR